MKRTMMESNGSSDDVANVGGGDGVAEGEGCDVA